MPRLIDADALLEKAEVLGSEGIVYVYDINNAPTVDAEPVVRCYDCQHSSVISKETNEGYCDLLNIEVTSMFGCVYGKEK